jgi:hypothetical protein
MIKLYRLAGIFASEQTVLQMVERLVKLKPQIVSIQFMLMLLSNKYFVASPFL